MSSASRLTQLQDRLAARGSRLQINQIVEDDPVPEFDRVGLELKAHRERKGHELEMAGRVLRIKTAHIRAIEESRFADLPGKTYAVGFVRSYAEYLGLNPDDCIRRFKIEYDEATKPSADEAGARKKSRLAFPDAHEDRRLPHGSLIVLTGIMVMAVWGGWYLTTSAERQFNDAETVALPPSDLPTPEDADAMLRAAADTSLRGAPGGEAASAGEAAEPDATPTEGASAPVTQAEQLVAALTGTGQSADAPTNDLAQTPLEANELPQAPLSTDVSAREAQVFGVQNNAARVILRARGNAWVRVEGPDGAVLFEETLVRGDSYRVPNRAGVILATRNAGAVELLLDGQSLGPVGAVGEPLLEVSLDAGTLRAGNSP